MVMTIEELGIRLRDIKRISMDYELAHIMEDRLKEDVLKEIANENPLSAELAKLVLTSSEIVFTRHYS